MWLFFTLCVCVCVCMSWALDFSSKTGLILWMLLCISLENKVHILIRKNIFCTQSLGTIFTSHDVVLVHIQLFQLILECYPHSCYLLGRLVSIHWAGDRWLHSSSVWQPMLCPKSTPTFLLSFCTSRFVPLRAIFLDTRHLSSVHLSFSFPSTI